MRGQSLLLGQHQLLGRSISPYTADEAFVFTLARAFAHKPGQKGSIFTEAASMRALILSCVILNLIFHQDKDPVGANEL